MIVTKVLNIITTAKNIYHKENIKYLQITVSDDNYLSLKTIGVTNEFTDLWNVEKLHPSEVKQAIKLVQRVHFKNETVHNLDNGIELYIKNNPKIKEAEKTIRDLYNATFYSELHEDDGHYDCIIKKNEYDNFRKFLSLHKNISVYEEDGIYELYL